MQEPVSLNPPSQQVNPQENPSIDSTSSSQGNSGQGRKSKKGLLLLLFIFTALLFGGLGAVGGKMLLCEKKTEEKKQSCTYNDTTYNDSDTFDADDACNECLCSDGTVSCTEMACETEISENGTIPGDDTDPYEGWNYSEYDKLGIGIKHPYDWHSSNEEIDKSTHILTLSKDIKNIIFIQDNPPNIEEEEGYDPSSQTCTNITQIIINNKNFPIEYCTPYPKTFYPIFTQVNDHFTILAIIEDIEDISEEDLQAIKLMFESIELL